jgi:hypothetical protein
MSDTTTSETTADAASADRPTKMSFYSGADAPAIEHDGIMSMPYLNPDIFKELDVAPVFEGQKVSVLFKGEGPDGFSLVHTWFGPGFKLPRHSHSADCLYYIIAGEITMGTRVMRGGDGFFVGKDVLYTYTAGPEGALVLEFRTATSFDMVVTDQTAAQWRPIVDAAVANHDRWVAERPDGVLAGLGEQSL